MSNKDPFAEPDDNERTVIRPNPGGKRPATPAAPPQQSYAPPPQQQGYGGQSDPGPAMGIPQQAAPRPSGGTDANAIAMTGMNPLTALATPLLSLVSRIRNRAQHMDPEKLRQSVMAEVRGFENAALKAGQDAQKVKVARYALCATLDDVVLNTPWGEQSVWAQQSMVGTFHRETVGGDRFYDLLARLEQDPNTNIDLLEFLYMCLSLGFEGRLRVEAGGADKHLQIRNALARIIRGQRGDVERDLSPRWKGVLRPYKALSAWRPVWIAVGATAAILALTYGGLAWALGQRSSTVLDQIAAIDSGKPATLLRRAPPPPPPPPQKEEVDHVAKLSSFLEQEIKDQVVTVFQKGNTVTIRLAGSGMFGSGSDALKPEFLPIITRVGEAMKGEEGNVVIAGHSDSSKVGGGRFKSNLELSQARADAVLKLLLPVVSDPKRWIAEGHGDKEPIADNKTKEGRATNRRIEILLVKEGS
ncbi:MAG: type IVB secretion system protein IcmH/DotU [bacterium]